MQRARHRQTVAGGGPVNVLELRYAKCDSERERRRGRCRRARSELRGGPRLGRPTGLACPADLPGLFGVATNLLYPITSEIFDHRTHFMPP